MFRSGLVAFAALFSVTVTATGWAYEIKPKSPDTAFSGKLKPDIVGLSSATEGSKAAPVFEAYLKDLPGVKPETAQQKFGGTNVTYVTAMKFTLAPTSTHRARSMLAVFSSPASSNRAYYISRLLGFSSDKQPSKTEMIERVTTKYGAPTAIGDGRMYYFYKGGKLMSVKQKYTPATALEALNAPINPKVAVALNDANGRGSCVAELKRSQALEKTLDKLVTEAKAANCDALISVEIFPVSPPIASARPSSP